MRRFIRRVYICGVRALSASACAGLRCSLTSCACEHRNRKQNGDNVPTSGAEGVTRPAFALCILLRLFITRFANKIIPFLCCAPRRARSAACEIVRKKNRRFNPEYGHRVCDFTRCPDCVPGPDGSAVWARCGRNKLIANYRVATGFELFESIEYRDRNPDQKLKRA